MTVSYQFCYIIFFSMTMSFYNSKMISSWGMAENLTPNRHLLDFIFIKSVFIELVCVGQNIINCELRQLTMHSFNITENKTYSI